MNSRTPGMNLLLNLGSSSRDLGEIVNSDFTEDDQNRQYRGWGAIVREPRTIDRNRRWLSGS